MMTDDKLMAHLVEVERQVAQLPARAAVAFAASCVAREAPVFTRAASELNLSSSIVSFDEISSALWEYTKEAGTSVLEEASLASSNLIPENMEVIGGVHGVVFVIANALRDLVSALCDGDMSYAHFMGCSEFGADRAPGG